MVREQIGMHEDTPEEQELYEREMFEKRGYRDPRALPAAEARKRYTIIRKRTRPMDFFDDVFTFVGMAYDTFLDKISRQ
jgi:hypothetical protein